MNDLEINDLNHRIIKELYRHRNGELANFLIKNNTPYKRVYGLLLPQLIEISNLFPNNSDLALYLWESKESREQRILGILLMPHDIDKYTALSMINDLKTKEEAELLPFKLIKKLPFANELIHQLNQDEIFLEDEIKRYFLLMLNKNLN